MGIRSMILERLSSEGTVFVLSPTSRAFAEKLMLDDDPSRQMIMSDVAGVLDGLVRLGLVSKDPEPDELNCDPRFPSDGPMTWAYRLTDKGNMELQRRSMVQASA